MTDTNDISHLAKKPPLDFARVDALRRRMLLTVDELCQLFGVSRVTYYAWRKGTPPRARTEARVKAVLRKLFWCMTERGWPSEEVLVADQPQRFQMLLELLKEFE